MSALVTVARRGHKLVFNTVKNTVTEYMGRERDGFMTFERTGTRVLKTPAAKIIEVLEYDGYTISEHNRAGAAVAGGRTGNIRPYAHAEPTDQTDSGSSGGTVPGHRGSEPAEVSRPVEPAGTVSADDAA